MQRRPVEPPLALPCGSAPAAVTPVSPSIRLPYSSVLRRGPLLVAREQGEG